MSNFVSNILKEYTASWENVYFTDPVTGLKAVVSPPYVMNIAKYVDESYRNHSANWKRNYHTGYFYTLDALQNSIEDPDGVDPSGSTKGKSRTEVIQRFLEIEGATLMSEPDNQDYYKALVHYGIGVDCSGFVSRAIARVMNRLNIDPSLRERTLGLTGGLKYKSNTTTLCCFKEGTNELSSHTGHKPVAPTALKPGDILFNKNGGDFHIRIVIDVLGNNSEGYIFQTAEASAAKSLMKVVRKDWKLDKHNDLYSKLSDSKVEWKKIDDWNIDNNKSLFHFGRPLAFVDLDDTDTVDDPEDYDFTDSEAQVDDVCTAKSFSEENDFAESEPVMTSDNSSLNANDIAYGITTGNVNLRPTASTKVAPLCVVPLGTIFRVELSEGIAGHDGTWYPVDYNGYQGYLSSVTFNADLSPVCTGYVSCDTPLAALIAAFNADASARRVFDEVHYNNSDSHLTLGFGHFAGGTQDEFLRYMLNHANMKPILISAFTKAFIEHPSFVSDARSEGYRMLRMSGENLFGVEDFLSSLNLENKAVNGRNKTKFPGGGVKNGYWLNDVLVDVLKDSIICAWQVKFWIEHTVGDAMAFSRKIGLADNYGAVATLVSLRSSGLMNQSFIQSKIAGMDKDTAAMWLWLYYNYAKNSKSTRGRQKAIFSIWYSRSWKITNHTDCPKALSDCTRLNVPMATAADGVAFNPDDNRNDYFNSLLDFILE